MRRFIKRTAKAAEIGPAQIIGEDEDDIRAFSVLCDGTVEIPDATSQDPRDTNEGFQKTMRSQHEWFSVVNSGDTS